MNASGVLKVGLFFAVWLGLWLPIAIPVAIAVRWRPGQPITTAQKLPLVGTLYLIAPGLLWAIARWQGQSLLDYGLASVGELGRSLLLGLAVGVGGLAILYGLEWLAGWIQWRKVDDSPLCPTNTPPYQWVLSTLATTLLVGVWIGFTEELVFRGFLLAELGRDVSLWAAGAIASLIFAVLHLVWEGRENIPQLPGLWLMGMVLTIAFWGDGAHIGLPWGLHAGWVWAIATLDTLQIVQVTGKVPAWVTGWKQHLLAGVMGNLFLLTTGLVLFWLTA